MNRSATGHGPGDGARLPHGFWERLPAASRRVLMVDFDGALVPFRAERDEARLPDDVREHVQHAVQAPGTLLVIVSGRPVAELDELIGSLRAHLVGEHGWEDRTVDGRMHVRRLPAPQAKCLGEAARAARERGWGEHLERKRCSIVLHTRALPPRLASALEREARRLWQKIARHHGLEIARIDGGVELLAPVHPDGNAIADVTTEPGTLPIYLCADVANTSALDPVLGRGIVIGVGPRPSRRTRFHLDGTQDMCDFLETWSRVA